MASSFVSMRNFWKEFNFPELQKTLDTTATELADRQDASDTSRRRLVELSRDFKKNTPEETRKHVAPLLKSFQSEIDVLSKRSKAAETAFLSIYKKLVDVPDPLPVLEQSIVQQQKVAKLQDYEIESKQLRETLEEYNSEFAEIKNQEVTINRLKDKIKEYEEKMEERVQVRLKDQEKELQKNFAEKERQLQENQLSVARKLGEAEYRVTTLQSALDNTQSDLFDLKSKFDEEAAARSSEVEILEADLERGNQRALAAERQIEAMRDELLKAQQAIQDASDNKRPNMEETIDAITKSSLEHELAVKDRQVSQLVSDVQRLQASMARMKESGSHEVSRLEEHLSAKSSALQAMEARLQDQHDYEEIKRELSVLKLIEFGPSEAADEQDPVQESTPKSLEMLLLDKNRRLQSENTSLKVENSGTHARLSELQKQYSEAVYTVKEQKELITQLESDLLSVNALPSAFRGQGEGEAVPPSGTELVSSAVNKAMTPTESVADKGAADSLLPIVASQRERFKVRNLELEAQTRHQQQQIGMLHNEVDNLRSDNVKLYEKIKFLQSYPAPGSHGRDEDAVSRYSSQYEQRLDPFSAFNQREKQQRYMNLGPHEKVTLNMGRFILGNKLARTFAFFYTIFLHFLVFLVLYKMASTESCKRNMASECAKKFAEHMQQVHGSHH